MINNTSEVHLKTTVSYHFVSLELGHQMGNKRYYSKQIHPVTSCIHLLREEGLILISSLEGTVSPSWQETHGGRAGFCLWHQEL